MSPLGYWYCSYSDFSNRYPMYSMTYGDHQAYLRDLIWLALGGESGARPEPQ
jgi:hypothetical protein